MTFHAVMALPKPHQSRVSMIRSPYTPEQKYQKLKVIRLTTSLRVNASVSSPSPSAVASLAPNPKLVI